MFSIDASNKTPVWKSFDFYKDNWSLIIFIPAIFGGILQIVKLFNLDPSFVRFFAVEQVVPDGLLALFLITLAAIMYFIFRNSFKAKHFKKINLGWTFKNVLTNIKYQLSSLMYCFIMIGFMAFANHIENGVITIGYIVFKTVLEFFVLKLLFDIFVTIAILYIFRHHIDVTNITEEDCDKLLKNLLDFNEKTIPLLSITIVSLGLFFAILIKLNFFYTNINKLNLPLNEQILVKKIKTELKIKTTPKIEYYNGKYVFIKVDNSNIKSNYLVLKGESLINIIEDKDK